ncbi:MAG: glycosyltransferase [Proteobacteria bacterium]|nr:glycosyltransferase [Pseudomonadota bacterium]MBU1234768.1 glycosyltransferase [Pseudomonadota bacterium]MBU1455755.1 glycosyltransferase [Pseudomonadota bacterium]
MSSKQSPPKITVIVTTYNRAYLLRQTIASVLSQSFEDYELLVLDDSSTDNTSEVVGSFSDHRITYIRNIKNLGFVNNWNKGLDVATGEYVIFPGDDDLLLPDCLGTLVNIMDDDQKLAMVTSNASLIDIFGEQQSDYYIKLDRDLYFNVEEYSKQVCLNGICNDVSYGFCFQFPGSMFRRKLLKESAFRFRQEAGCFADMQAFVELNLKFPLYFINEPQILRRIHSGQLSFHKHIGNTQNLMIFFSCLKNMLESYGVPYLSNQLNGHISLVKIHILMEQLAQDKRGGMKVLRDNVTETLMAFRQECPGKLPMNRSLLVLALFYDIYTLRDRVALKENGVFAFCTDDSKLLPSNRGELVNDLYRWRYSLRNVSGGLGQRMFNSGMKRIALHGASLFSLLVLEEIALHGGPDVIAILDNDEHKWGSSFFGLQIMAPQAFFEQDHKVDTVIVSIGRGSDKSVKAQLLETPNNNNSVLTWMEFLDHEC